LDLPSTKLANMYFGLKLDGAIGSSEGISAPSSENSTSKPGSPRPATARSTIGR
jgi:hypothetical protein